jgi:hypothetical protein
MISLLFLEEKVAKTPGTDKISHNSLMLRSCKQHPSVGCCLSLTAYRSSIGGKRTRFSRNNSNAEKHRSNIICPISDV